MNRHRQFKTDLYGQFEHLGRALAGARRLEILDLLGQGEMPVDALARAIDTPVKNTSAHLRALRLARLVETRREGTRVFYRLADEEVLRLVRALQRVAHGRLADIRDTVHRHLDAPDGYAPVTLAELQRLVRTEAVTLLDVRPAGEFAAGHIPGAISAPLGSLRRQLARLPKHREVVAYCRGPYCLLSLEAVRLLRRHGFRARRTKEGMPDWRAAGFPVARGA
ncbi:MAG: metalloregulator ArsR/SmtB family transcription factor [Gemmatimonadota bacterium]|nr:metalloregulator ArsR/SmtB family transcription factor [Gemmatimonadota bacterium]